MKRVFQILAFVSFGVVFAIVGGVEHGSFGLLGGIVTSIASLVCAAVFAKLGGMFYER